MIILIHGLKRSGKDTFASILKELEPAVEIKPFAGPLKEITAKAFDLAPSVIDYLKNDESIKIWSFSRPFFRICYFFTYIIKITV